MVETGDDDAEIVIKIIDFSLSKLLTEKVQMKTKIGTAYYMAPEVLEGVYTEACDMWSVGVIAFTLLCGYPPFNAENEAKLFYKIKTCDYEFFEDDWSHVS